LPPYGRATAIEWLGKEFGTMVRIIRKLDSETLHLPELRPLIGKTVEITIKEETVPEITPGTGDWDAAQKARRHCVNVTTTLMPGASSATWT